MDAILTIGIPVLVLVGWALLARRIARRRLGHSVLGPIELDLNPGARRTELLLEEQTAVGDDRRSGLTHP